MQFDFFSSYPIFFLFLKKVLGFYLSVHYSEMCLVQIAIFFAYIVVLTVYLYVCTVQYGRTRMNGRRKGER